MQDLEQAVREEVEALHRFFVGWFSGAVPVEDFDAGMIARLDPALVLVPPGGRLLGLDELAEGIRAAHGSNPDFRIAIRNVVVRRATEELVIATYEEWQRNALASTPPDNGRLATVVFTRTEPLRFLHVHETWLPAEQMAAGPYDF